MTIYTDNGASRGCRTRYFRDAEGGGVEWIYAVDHAGPAPRWCGFMPIGAPQTVAAHIACGAQWESLQ